MRLHTCRCTRRKPRQRRPSRGSAQRSKATHSVGRTGPPQRLMPRAAGSGPRLDPVVDAVDAEHVPGVELGHLSRSAVLGTTPVSLTKLCRSRRRSLPKAARTRSRTSVNADFRRSSRTAKFCSTERGVRALLPPSQLPAFDPHQAGLQFGIPGLPWLSSADDAALPQPHRIGIRRGCGAPARAAGARASGQAGMRAAAAGASPGRPAV
jgi:hypothetical protein